MADARKRADVASVVNSFRNAASLIDNGVRSLRILVGDKRVDENKGQQALASWSQALREIADKIEDDGVKLYG